MNPINLRLSFIGGEKVISDAKVRVRRVST